MTKKKHETECEREWPDCAALWGVSGQMCSQMFHVFQLNMQHPLFPLFVCPSFLSSSSSLLVCAAASSVTGFSFWDSEGKQCGGLHEEEFSRNA